MSGTTGPTSSKQINLFTSGDDQVGSTWQYQYFTLLADKVSR